ncbi:MAG: DnaJ domain-containing protein, partial [Deltaproteobacteria bacterium]|nr:DnaJ domain-containing protein [Deltaproteobacteria bacterium]
RPNKLRHSSCPGLDKHDCLILVLRSLACALSGICQFSSENIAPNDEIVDPIGEALVAIITSMSESQLAEVWQARKDLLVKKNIKFDTILNACRQIGAPDITITANSMKISELTHIASLAHQRTIAALLFLDGLSKTDETANPTAETVIHTNIEQPTENIIPSMQSNDSELMRIINNINKQIENTASQNFYEILGINSQASVNDIRKVYFELAKKWHVDRFANLNIDQDAKNKVEEIFLRISEAHRILIDPEQRKAYDYVIDRHAQGLPTDPGEIFEAETLFTKAQTLIRRGQAAQAYPLLLKAVELNRGEAEFWVYLGYALYCAKGSEAAQQAQEHIKQGLKIRERQDIAYDFLGRIARVEGHSEEARKYFIKALELNPNNPDAARELRLIHMRTGKYGQPQSGFGGLIARLFKRK